MIDIVHNIFSESTFFQGGLALMVTGWVGYQLRSIPGRALWVSRGLYTRVIEVREHHPLYEAWLGMLTDGALRKGGPRTLEVRVTSDEYEERAASSAFAAGSDDFWSRVCGKLCRVSISRENSSAGGHDLVRRFIIEIEVLFASAEDLERMLEAAKARANVVEHRQLVDLCNKYGSNSTIALPKRDPSTLCLPRGFFESLEGRVREFTESREDYERVGIPWRLGILFHGEPGTGKTSLAHTLASVLGRRLAVIPLADLQSDEDLISAFEGVRDGGIVLIEDVDCAFRKRDNEDAEGITFSGFLNCIDGVIAPQNGRILIMSTNHIDRLDPALVRPGRVDIRLEVPLLTREAAADYVDRLYPHLASRHEIVDEVTGAKGATSAVLINRLMRERWRRPSGEAPRRAELTVEPKPAVGTSARKRPVGRRGAGWR